MRRNLLILAATVLVAACSPGRSGTPSQAPAFELSDISGKRVSLESLKGKSVLLDFWATWCGPCRFSIPTVREFYTKHKDDNFVVLGLNMDEDTSHVPEFLRNFEVNYPVLLAGSSDVPEKYGVQGIPHFVFIDPAGRIVERFEGFHPGMVSDWEEILQRIKASKS